MIHLNNNMAISFIRHRLHIILLRVEYRFVGKQIKDGEGWAYKNSGIMLHRQDPKQC